MTKEKDNTNNSK